MFPLTTTRLATSGAGSVDPQEASWRRRTGVPRGVMLRDTPAWVLGVVQTETWTATTVRKVLRRSVTTLLTRARRNRLRVWRFTQLRRMLD